MKRSSRMPNLDSLRPGSVAVVYGTRPEVIKLAPLVKILGDKADLIHTGQHYDDGLSGQIEVDLAFPPSRVTLGIGAQSRAAQIGAAVSALERHLVEADAVIVQGDTNSALAGGLAANAMEKTLCHVEAGLRSYDRRMPEEHNRVVVDHLSDLCWAPTVGNEANLLAEGVDKSRIEVTGNTIVEALRQILPSAETRAATLARYGLDRAGYVLATIHRPENVDDPARLAVVIKSLGEIPMPVVLPAHPRTMAAVEAGGLIPLAPSLTLLPPVGYHDFLSLLADCSFAVSDSGGVQEEVSLLKIPLIVVRRSTERPEVLGTYATLVSDPAEVAVEANRIIANLDDRRAKLQLLDSPFGDGHSAKRMVDSLVAHLTMAAS